MNQRAILSCVPVLLFFSFLSQHVSGGEDAPANSDLVVDESFDGATLSDQWHVNSGSWSVANGVMRAQEVASEHHAAAARRKIETENAVYQMRFRLIGEGKAFHFGFDPAPGELTKKGHLFSVIVTPTSWRLMKHVDKARPKEDPNETLAEDKTAFEHGKWYQLRVTTWDKYVSAKIEGKASLEASHDTFAVKKPTLVFRCLGDGVEIDDIKVWRQKK